MSHISIYQRFLLPNPLHTCKVSLPLQPQKQNGAIAQLVEQRTENPCVPGSIPGGTTQETPKCLIVKHFGVFLFTVKQEVTYKVTYELSG